MIVNDITTAINNATLEDDACVLFRYHPVDSLYYLYDYSEDEKLILYFVKDAWGTFNYPLGFSDLKTALSDADSDLEVEFHTFEEIPPEDFECEESHELQGMGIDTISGTLTFYPRERYYAEEEVQHGPEED